MSYLLDTNLLLRLVDSNAPQHATAAKAVAVLKNSDTQPFITPQNLIEFWAVATRPIPANGLGWTPTQTGAELGRLSGFFPMLADTSAVFDEWFKLVRSLPIAGKRTHDARLVAVMLAHHVSHLLTFNTPDFAVFAQITVVDPNVMAQQG